MSSTDQIRLHELQRYQIMDTAAEKAFDDLTRLASAICEAPISLISLLDDERQWFKSRMGLNAEQTPIEHTFCRHAIEGDDLFVVEDAEQDPRFATNPLVTSDPDIRFYAGAPLTTSAQVRIGTLCVIDTQPRALTDAQRKALCVLRDAVMTLLELRRTTHELKELEQMVPMCAWCRNIRDDSSGEAEWHTLEEFVARATPVTHGICPDCKVALQQDSA